MATATLIPVERYLRAAYRPDCDYLEGELVERNVGEMLHAWLQRFFAAKFLSMQAEWQMAAVPEARVQVRSDRFRVPDITAVSLDDLVLTVVEKAPALCIEIFSSDDRMDRMLERIADYQDMGVRAVWVIDPWRRIAYASGQERGKLLVVEDVLSLPESPVQITVAEVFADLDWLERRAKSE